MVLKRWMAIFHMYPPLDERNTYLRAHSAICVNKLDMGVFRLDFRNLGVRDSASKQSLERADGVLEVGDLKSLCRLADSALLGSE